MEKKNEFSRRKFCKTASCTAAGVMLSAGAIGGVFNNMSENERKKLENEIMENVIKVKVISQKGTCGAGHKVGDTIKITGEGVEGKICIHALYSFLPKVFAMMYDAKFSWLSDPDVSTSACPDAYNPVVFEVSRK